MSALLLTRPNYLRVEIMKYLTQITTQVRHIPIWDHLKVYPMVNIPIFTLTVEECYSSIQSLKQIECGFYSVDLKYLKTVNSAN